MNVDTEHEMIALDGASNVIVIDRAYELAVFQICDEGGLYTELTADEIQRMLRREIAAEVIRTGGDDLEKLKAAALIAVRGFPARAYDESAQGFSHLRTHEGPC